MYIIGMKGKVWKLNREFLTNRSRSVIVNGKLSDAKQVISGVPQRTVLGTILFLYQTSIRASGSLSFADDTQWASWGGGIG